jgi:uncharacterized protein YjbI with pentapeptide repeats
VTNAYVDFSFCGFEGVAVFQKTQFSGSPSFFQSFFKDAKFIEVYFKRGSSFVNCTFEKGSFIRVNFGWVYFHSSTFQNALFVGSVFRDNATFSGVVFNFVRFIANETGRATEFCIFKEEVDFTGATFRNFQIQNTIFCGKTVFRYASFNEGNIARSYFHGTTDFGYSLFYSGNKVRFDVRNASKISFRNSDITQVRFAENIRWGENNRFKIFDESQLERSPDVELSSVISVYRNLQKNCQLYYRFEEEDQFYLREMELRRNYSEIYKDSKLVVKKKSILGRNFSFLGLYRFFSKYRLSYLRPIGVIIAFVMALIAIRVRDITINEQSNLLAAVTQSLSKFLMVDPSDLPYRLSYIIISSFIIVLLIPAIRNYLGRRTREN